MKGCKHWPQKKDQMNLPRLLKIFYRKMIIDALNAQNSFVVPYL